MSTSEQLCVFPDTKVDPLIQVADVHRHDVMNVTRRAIGTIVKRMFDGTSSDQADGEGIQLAEIRGRSRSAIRLDPPLRSPGVSSQGHTRQAASPVASSLYSLSIVQAN